MDIYIIAMIPVNESSYNPIKVFKKILKHDYLYQHFFASIKLLGFIRHNLGFFYLLVTGINLKRYNFNVDFMLQGEVCLDQIYQSYI